MGSDKVYTFRANLSISSHQFQESSEAETEQLPPSLLKILCRRLAPHMTDPAKHDTTLLKLQGKLV